MNLLRNVGLLLVLVSLAWGSVSAQLPQDRTLLTTCRFDLVAYDRFTNRKDKRFRVITGDQIVWFGVDQKVTREVAISPNGRLLATAHIPRATNLDSVRTVITVWDIASNRASFTYSSESWSIRQLAFDPSGTFLAIALDSGIDLVDLASGKRFQTIVALGNRLAFSSDGKVLATIGDHPEITLWAIDRDVNGPHVRELRRIKETSGARLPPLSLAVSADHSMVASGSIEGVDLCDTSTGIVTPLLRGNRVESIKFSPDGKRLVAGGDSGRTGWVRVVDVQGNGNPVRQFECPMNGIVDVYFSASGDCVAAASLTGEVVFFRLDDGARLVVSTDN